MILLHRLKGEPLVLNADLIESIESTPDTVITLVDGRKTVVAESPAEIVERITSFRAAILAAADELRSPTAHSPSLVLLRGDGEEG